MLINQLFDNCVIQMASYENPNSYQVLSTQKVENVLYLELHCINFNQKELLTFDCECFNYNQVLHIKGTDLHLFNLA